MSSLKNLYRIEGGLINERKSKVHFLHIAAKNPPKNNKGFANVSQ